MSCMKTTLLDSIPQTIVNEMSDCVFKSLEIASNDIQVDPSFWLVHGKNNQGPYIHQSVGYALLARFKHHPLVESSSIRYTSGRYVFLKVGQFEISIQYLYDRNALPSISNRYQAERIRNNPTNQSLLFDESISEEPIFVILCYGIDSLGAFAFLFLPSSGFCALERKELLHVEEEEDVNEEQ